MRILIVDDSQSIHAYLRDLLNRDGHQLTHVHNGLQALNVCAHSDAFDLILLDWEMPELNGPETLRKLMADGCRASVVMMTSRNMPEEIRSMLELGAFDYVMKPFTDDIILEKIKDAGHG